MGTHRKSGASLAARAWVNRRKIAAVVIVALPLAARYVPGFPTDETVAVLRVFLGA